MFPEQVPFLEHFTGFPARSAPLARPADPLLDPLMLGVLTAALEVESADAYQHGFRDGLRAAALMPTDLDLAESAGLEDPFCTGDGPAEAPGQGDWQR